MKFLRFFISLFLISLMFYIYKDEILQFDFSKFKFKNLLYLLFLMSLTVLITSSRYFFSFKSVGIFYPFNKTFNLGLSSNLMGQILPGGGMGGDIFKFILFSKLKVDKRLITKSILIDRGVPLFLALMISCLFIFSEDNYIYLLICLFGLLLIFYIFIIKFKLETIYLLISASHSSILILLSSYIFYSILNNFGASITFYNCLIGYCFVFISKIIPSYGGWGVRETVSALSFNLFGIDPSLAIICSIYFGLILALSSLILGIFYIDDIIKIVKK